MSSLRTVVPVKFPILSYIWKTFLILQLMTWCPRALGRLNINMHQNLIKAQKFFGLRWVRERGGCDKCHIVEAQHPQNKGMVSQILYTCRLLCLRFRVWSVLFVDVINARSLIACHNFSYLFHNSLIAFTVLLKVAIKATESNIQESLKLILSR